ncbi:MAG: putative viral capsid protein [Circoviridae sp.]|nr:MAG: putative viral capsid protein [Circoviridae sp.]
MVKIPKGFVRKRRKRTVDASQNKKIKSLEKKVKLLGNLDEEKWVDAAVSTNVTTTGTVTPLLNFPTWAGSNVTRPYSREGNSLVLTELKMQGMVQIPGSNTVASNDASNRVRIVIIKTMENGATPAYTDIFENSDIDSYYKIKGKFRYKQMFDRTYNLTNLFQASAALINLSAVGNSSERWRIPFKVNLKKKLGKSGTKCTYSALGGSGANPVNNGLFLLTLSDSGAISHPFVKYRSRIRFLDQ